MAPDLSRTTTSTITRSTPVLNVTCGLAGVCSAARSGAVAAVPVGTTLLGDSRSGRRKAVGLTDELSPTVPEISAVLPICGFENGRSDW